MIGFLLIVTYVSSPLVLSRICGCIHVRSSFPVTPTTVLPAACVRSDKESCARNNLPRATRNAEAARSVPSRLDPLRKIQCVPYFLSKVEVMLSYESHIQSFSLEVAGRENNNSPQ